MFLPWGMTQSHFPKVGQNKSLLSDEERSRINEATDEHRRLDIVTQINSKRGHFVAMSLFNAASEQLVLSQPQIINESQDDMSVYLKELLDLGIPWWKRDAIVSKQGGPDWEL